MLIQSVSHNATEVEAFPFTSGNFVLETLKHWELSTYWFVLIQTAEGHITWEYRGVQMLFPVWTGGIITAAFVVFVWAALKIVNRPFKLWTLIKYQYHTFCRDSASLKLQIFLLIVHRFVGHKNKNMKVWFAKCKNLDKESGILNISRYIMFANIGF